MYSRPHGPESRDFEKILEDLRERMKGHEMTDLRTVKFILFMNGGAKGQADQEDEANS